MRKNKVISILKFSFIFIGIVSTFVSRNYVETVDTSPDLEFNQFSVGDGQQSNRLSLNETSLSSKGAFNSKFSSDNGTSVASSSDYSNVGFSGSSINTDFSSTSENQPSASYPSIPVHNENILYANAESMGSSGGTGNLNLPTASKQSPSKDKKKNEGKEYKSSFGNSIVSRSGFGNSQEIITAPPPPPDEEVPLDEGAALVFIFGLLLVSYKLFLGPKLSSLRIGK